MAPPRLILTSGEPAGVGPDVCIAIAEREWPCELVIAGDIDLLRERARRLGARVALSAYDRAGPAQEKPRPGVRVLHVPVRAQVTPGRLDPANAPYVLELLDIGAAGCLSGEFQAIVTAPVQKSVISESGVPFSGHTEYLAAKTGGAHPVMMLVAGALRVALATTHLPLAEVSRSITRERLMRVISILDRDLRERFGIEAPRILVCGLNPHAGESGCLGREEIEVIEPVIAELAARGLRVTGPAPADTAFTPRMLEGADVVLAMYHDQGLPVIKYAGFGEGVNVTLGLPIIRTSVDHGVALSLAGSGNADAGSLAAAVALAIELANTQRRATPGRDVA